MSLDATVASTARAAWSCGAQAKRRLAAVVAFAGLVAAPAAAQFVPLDPCVRCELIYSGDSAGRLYEIDPEAGTSRLIGTTPTFFDIAMTVDGRLFGVSGGGAVQQISACDASVGPALGSYSTGANGLAGALRDPLLYAQGPPLSEADLSVGFTARVLGGVTGAGGPPEWCGGSSGDLAFDPGDGRLYSALACGSCPGDALAELDPITGEAVRDVGCLVDESGAPLVSTYGLAFDSCGDFWTGTAGSSDLIRIDPLTAVGERVPITGGYSGTYGLASIPCLAVGGACSPCAVQVVAGTPPPEPVGPALRATGHGPPATSFIIGQFEWDGDRGLPRPEGEHYHVYRGDHPAFLELAVESHPWAPRWWTDISPRAPERPACTYVRVVAVDTCEFEELQ